ncbi:MAG: hypothetical protein JWM25_1045 [Thermoleophilia bacterium]|nr:hypothetical protein [Thermoleophilia bacterium]MCZ4496462.1 hypothetical protein [Thermoleophilia bacterium]
MSAISTLERAIVQSSKLAETASKHADAALGALARGDHAAVATSSGRVERHLQLLVSRMEHLPGGAPTEALGHENLIYGQSIEALAVLRGAGGASGDGGFQAISGANQKLGVMRAGFERLQELARPVQY